MSESLAQIITLTSENWDASLGSEESGTHS